jgi:hypothetical protein
MNLQTKIDQTDLDMTLPQVKAFFLGAMLADKPMPFPKALEEMIGEAEDAFSLSDDFQTLWNQLEANKVPELEGMFPEVRDNRSFLASAKDQLDFFLTALSLAGTNVENCKSEEVAELIDELEDAVMDLEDYLAEDLDDVEADELKVMLIETWRDFLRVRGVKR